MKHRLLPIIALLSTLLLPCMLRGAEPTLKIMSFNIRFDNPADSGDLAWTVRQEPIRRMFEDARPDVVGMQEPRLNMLEATYALLPEYDHYKIEASDSITDPMTGNIVIFYRTDRFEAADSGYFWLSETPEQPSRPWNSTDTHYRCALWLKLRDVRNDSTFYFCTTHFPYKKAPVDTEVRARCAAMIVERMKAIAGPNAPVFVTGDMNASDDPADPRHTSLDPFFAGMKAARHEAAITNCRASFNGFGRKFKNIHGKNLDHIFYLNAEPLCFETLDSPNYGVQYISDHYPILCHFKL